MDDMLRAVYRGEGKKLLKLLQKGGDVNRLDRDGRTLLMSAVCAGKDELVQILLENKADPNLQDKAGFPPSTSPRKTTGYSWWNYF